MLKSKTRFGHLKRAFSSGSGFDTKIARLVVLFEDLRLESYGMAEPKIDALDSLRGSNRRVYFLRRATVTLTEFISAMTQLNSNSEFQSFTTRSRSIGGKNWKPWDEAMRELNQLRPLLKGVRDATGAHFSSDSASLAVSNLSADTVGKIEGIVHRSREGAGCMFHFAPELAAAAIVGELEGRAAKDKVEELVQTILGAVGYASQAMHQLVVNYLFDRFG